MDSFAYLARPSRLGLVTALGAGLIALGLCLTFELVVPIQNNYLANYLVEKNFSLRAIILYATAGGMHIILCTAGIVFFIFQLKTSESKLEFQKIILGATIGFAIIFGIILVACYFNINLVQQSFDERIRPLHLDARLNFLLTTIFISHTGISLKPLALFPLLLIALGVAVAIVACFWIAHKAITFANKADDLKKREIVEMKRSVAQLIGLTSIIFTTSTLATIALMQLGRDWIERGSARDAYIQNGDGMSIFWSACYTAIVGATVLIPLCWIAGYTRRIQRQARYSGGKASFYDHIYDVISFRFVSQAAIAILAPVATSILAAIFGS